MDQFKLLKPMNLLAIAILFLFITGCEKEKHNWAVSTSEHHWLVGKKIFIDPGHGGKGKTDRFRIGPNGITEEDINLKVSLSLQTMLKEAGAVVYMSRSKNIDISVDERAVMIEEISPDILVSIHHNGSAHREDGVNYPCVLIWGSKDVRPASYDFAKLLLNEFQRYMEIKGPVLSDFSIFNETGTRILRKTRYVCPGVIGEAGFFSDKDHAIRLNDKAYTDREAEAYFTALSEYFRRGLPSAEVYISAKPNNESFLMDSIKTERPEIVLKLNSGNEQNTIKHRTLKITLDNIPVTYKKKSEDMYIVKYGNRLYPGGHRIKFSFKNWRGQSSMIYNTSFTIDIKKGDYKRLVKRGTRLIKKYRTAKEGLKMLLSALSMSLTEPDSDKLVWLIAKGYKRIGLPAESEYYYKKLYYFYPQSRYRKYVSRRIKKCNSYRYPVEYHGKRLDLQEAFTSDPPPSQIKK